MSQYVMITMDGCKWCPMALDALKAAGHDVKVLNMSEHVELSVILSAIGAKTVPQVLQVVGGYEATVEHLK